VLAHNSDDRGLMAREIELHLDEIAPSQGKPSRARGSQQSSLSNQVEQERSFRRGNAATEQRQSRRSAIRNEDDSELLIHPEDLDIEALDDEEARFLRTEKRVPIRRSSIPKKTAKQLRVAGSIAAVAITVIVLTSWAYSYGIHSWRFRIESSDSVEISGVRNASRAQVMEVAAADVGRNIFFVPLDERKRQLEQIPWVEQATVMRLLPNRIAVSIEERTPVAFAQIGPRISLMDAKGVVMGMPANRQTKYSFPVIRGIAETEPLSSRSAAMKIYNRLVSELGASDATGVDYVKQLSEVDLSDPEDVKVTANDAGGAMVVHLGASDFLPRYKLYVTHVAEWRQQFPNLQSVDLRYEGQVVVNPDNKDRVTPTQSAQKPRGSGAPVAGSSGHPAPARTTAARPKDAGDRGIGKTKTLETQRNKGSGGKGVKPPVHTAKTKHAAQR
jgi:cell division protein FtsQ